MNCFLCKQKPVWEKLPYIIEKDMRGVILGVCKSCLKNQTITEKTPCNGECKCMLYAGELMINPRVRHTPGFKNCTGNTHNSRVYADTLTKNNLALDEIHKHYAVYYNAVERMYEVSDVEYFYGPEGIVNRITNADMNNVNELKTIISSGVGISFSDDGMLMEGFPILDWAVINRKYALIEAIGESSFVILNNDTAFSLAIENDDVEALALLVKYNMNYHQGAEGRVCNDDSVDQISAYDMGMKSTNPKIRSLVLLASINPEMRRILRLDTTELISLRRKTVE